MYSEILKKAVSSGSKIHGDAQRKAWLSRSRAIIHGGKGVGWKAADGSDLSENELQRLKEVGAVPAWKQTWLSTDPKLPLQVLGLDQADRYQYKYLKAFLAKNQLEKFARVYSLNKHIPKLNDTSTKDMLDESLPRAKRDAAAVVNLCLKTGFRPGSTSDTKAKVQAYGASTLEKRHVKIHGSVMSFTFVGKSGKVNVKKLDDPDLAKFLTPIYNSSSAHDSLFTASAAAANAYMKSVTGGNFLVKDLRTWNGTALAKKMVKAEKMPKNEVELKAQKKRVALAVSIHLNNTPAVALDKYIDPTVFKMVGGMKEVKG